MNETRHSDWVNGCAQRQVYSLHPDSPWLHMVYLMVPWWRQGYIADMEASYFRYTMQAPISSEVIRGLMKRRSKYREGVSGTYLYPPIPTHPPALHS